MRSSLAMPLAIALATVPALAQNPTIDLGLWTVEDINGTGPWTITPPRLFCSTTNTVNTDCSVFYSDFQMLGLLEFRMDVDPSGGDDDLPGFVLGWNPGDSSNTTADYLLVDWKKVTQTYQNWGTAPVGLAISHVSGAFTRGYGGGPIDLWSHTGVCTELARGNVYGAQGWVHGTRYNFRVLFTPASVDIWVNGVQEFHVTGTFNIGRFGCYNFSQSKTEFQFPLPGAFTAFGTGCQGSAGVPNLFSSATPYVGETLPIVMANIPASAPALLALGLSNSSWGGIPLPLDLGVFGATGCNAYVSGDAFIPITNFSGTANINLALPASLLPSTGPRFFFQGIAIDPAANSLGLVFSNAAAMTVGIR